MGHLQGVRLRGRRDPAELVERLARAGHHLCRFRPYSVGLSIELDVVQVVHVRGKELDHLPLAHDHRIEPFDIVCEPGQNPDEIVAAFDFRHWSSF